MNTRIVRNVSGAAGVTLLLLACEAFAGPPKSAAPAAPMKPSSGTTDVAPKAAPMTPVPVPTQPPIVVPFLAKLSPIAPAKFCASEGSIAPSGSLMRVSTGAMRGVISSDRSRSAEVDFTYRGPSKDTQPLLDGEIRRQIGLKLKAQDTCNVVYVMWHIAPTPGLFVLVKRNVGKSTYDACKDGGYITAVPTSSKAVPDIAVGVPHTLRADLDGVQMRVVADSTIVWEGNLPEASAQIDGPSGVRSDNGTFDFQLLVPGGAASSPSCR